MKSVACPECAKELQVPRKVLGKRIRCTGCRAPFVAPEPSESDEPDPIEGAVPGLTCPECGAAAVVPLEPNQFSRRPGYDCAMCEALMRAPGSKGTVFAIMGLGGFITLLGIGLVVFALNAERGKYRMIALATVIAVAGISVARWAFQQSRLPEPVGAEHPRLRTGLIIGLLLLGLLVAGGLIFTLMYFMQEML